MTIVTAGEFTTSSACAGAASVITSGAGKVATVTSASKVRLPASTAATLLKVYVAVQIAALPTGSGFAAGTVNALPPSIEQENAPRPGVYAAVIAVS
jgi:hypothetical protein